MFRDEETPLGAWALAQAAAESVKDIAYNTNKRALKLVEFVKDSLLPAYTFTEVFIKIVKPDRTNTATDVDRLVQIGEPQEIAGLDKPGKWHEIECVLKRQKRSGKDMFLVRWKESK